MTPEGYEQARKKLDHLKNVEMPRVQKALGDAREMGDLSENAEFDAAREEMWKLDTVAIGAAVKVEDVDKKMKDEFLLVGEGEIREGVDTVSVTSPLGSALIGKKVGEIAEVQAPRGKIRYKIVSFKYG